MSHIDCSFCFDSDQAVSLADVDSSGWLVLKTERDFRYRRNIVGVSRQRQEVHSNIEPIALIQERVGYLLEKRRRDAQSQQKDVEEPELWCWRKR